MIVTLVHASAVVGQGAGKTCQVCIVDTPSQIRDDNDMKNGIIVLARPIPHDTIFGEINPEKVVFNFNLEGTE